MAHDDRFFVVWIDKDTGHKVESRELTEKVARGYAKILEGIGHKVTIVPVPKKK